MPKLFLPVPGIYTIRLKVRDAAGEESHDPGYGPSKEWEYITLLVVPKNKIYVQLTWDKGNSVDLDLFMARYRENGTLGYPFAFKDRVQVPGPGQIACESDTDCHAGHPGWFCDERGTEMCQSHNNSEWHCESDEDCVYAERQYYCNPFDVNDPNSRWMCSKHTFEQTNDSCSFHNPRPDWGEVGNRRDNPSLDFDDMDGWGPEIIRLSDPTPGRYRVVARLTSDPHNEVTATDPVNAEVSVYVRGEYCGEYTIPMADLRPHCSGQCGVRMYWKVADIKWFENDADNSCADSVRPVSLIPAPQNDPPQLSDFCLDAGDPVCEYANPFNAVFFSVFDPCDEELPRSIWCDGEDDLDCSLMCE